MTTAPADGQPPGDPLPPQPAIDPPEPPRRRRKPRHNPGSPDPTPEEVLAMTALIRAGWDEKTHRERAGKGEPEGRRPPRGRFGVIH